MYGWAIGLIKPSNCNLHNTALYANSCAKTGSHCCISFSLKMLKCSYRLKFVVGSTKYHKVSKNIPKHFRWKCNLKVSIKEQKYEQYQNRDCIDNHGAISWLCVQNVSVYSFQVCPPGYHSNDGAQSCTDCAIGTFSNETSNDPCFECGPNQSTATTNSTDSSDCSEYNSQTVQNKRRFMSYFNIINLPFWHLDILT